MTPNEPALDWIATWGAAPDGLPDTVLSFSNQTLRMVVRVSIGASQLRIRLSNEHGEAALHIGAAQLGLRQAGADIVPGSSRALSFSGYASITIPPGAPVLSDPVALLVPDQGELVVSLYLPGNSTASTVHGCAAQTSYVSLPGNFSAAARFPLGQRMDAWLFLSEVDVLGYGSAVVCLGDFVTNGNATTRDANHRWPDFLAMRVHAARELVAQRTDRLVSIGGQLGVVNRGTSGNGQATPADAALVRFERDVLATAGVRYVIVQLGIHELAAAATIDDLVGVYRQLIARSRAAGLQIYGVTLLPCEGAHVGTPGEATELLRQAANYWIRCSDEFDAVIDADQALRDPARVARLLPAFDSGDHLHPNDLGMQALADAIPLALFHLPDPGFAGTA
jgi:lysophospholipase L1-like esterase